MILEKTGILVLSLLFFINWSDGADPVFEIDIDAAGSEDEIRAFVSGKSVSTLQVTDIKTWELTDENLKKFVKNYFNGFDFFQSMRLSGDRDRNPVQQILYPLSVKNHDITYHPVTLAKVGFENYFSDSVDFSGGIKKEVTNSVKTSWKGSESYSIDSSIRVGVNFGVFSAGASVSFGYNSQWGASDTKEEKTTISYTSTVTIPSKPGDKGFIIIQSNQSEATIDVTYQGYLKGDVILIGTTTRGKKQEVFLDVNALLKYNNIPITRNITQTLVLSYYSNTQLNVVKDGDTILKTYASESAPHETNNPPPGTRPKFLAEQKSK